MGLWTKEIITPSHNKHPHKSNPQWNLSIVRVNHGQLSTMVKFLHVASCDGLLFHSPRQIKSQNGHIWHITIWPFCNGLSWQITICLWFFSPCYGRYYFIYNVGETSLPPLPLPEPNVPEDPCWSTAQMSALRVEVPDIIQLPRFVLCWNGLEPAHSKEHISYPWIKKFLLTICLGQIWLLEAQ